MKKRKEKKGIKKRRGEEENHRESKENTEEKGKEEKENGKSWKVSFYLRNIRGHNYTREGQEGKEL